MVRSDWVGHSGVTSAHFSPVACSALWLITYRTNGLVLHLTDAINLGVRVIVSVCSHLGGVPHLRSG